MAKTKVSLPAARSDLVVLTADQDILNFLKRLLDTRCESLQIRPLKYEIKKHIGRDPGCRVISGKILTSYVSTHKYAIVVFDHEGCGGNKKTREELEAEVEAALAKKWEDRVAVVVIYPELEAWIWTMPSKVAEVTLWTHDQTLPDWLVEKGHFKEPNQVKPVDPKKALDAVLYKVNARHTSHIFTKFAEKVTFNNCTDPAFLKLLTTLRKWFPVVG